MGFFGNKKNVVDEQTRELNELLNTALEFNQQTGTWTDFPDNVLPETKEQVIAARKLILEYIRQLREARVYSDGAVRKFAAEQYPWMNKQNLQKFLSLGKLQLN